MSELVERLRWNVKNSATASRLNMAIDQEQAAARIEELERALQDARNRLRGAGLLGGLDDPIRVVLERDIRQAMGKAARAVLEKKA